ncbi:pentatricopeptide repeat-containing protein At1g11290, chloroplastic [Cryptomeria japonica]|uniref:pentatricopeptide repeat-containing protein At1g11290, chloroplastic n=1 Tax=Cryptomeria japonica TaxID=3369 RepID=UPI0025AC0EBB|nr:pentatricopeptide repeat-containing protein At1g11290, chloroplastic [Cryptomeria japonica]
MSTGEAQWKHRQACCSLMHPQRVFTIRMRLSFNFFLNKSHPSTDGRISHAVTYMHDTCRLFNHTASYKKYDAFSWNVMIREHANSNSEEKEALALTIYSQMQQNGIHADKYTFPFVLKVCANLSALQKGKQIHNHVIRRGFQRDIYVGNSLVSMYAKCRKVEVARQVFDRISQKDVVSWNAMIIGYVQCGIPEETLVFFHQMYLDGEGVLPDQGSFVSVLQACTDLLRGKWIHKCVICAGLEADVFVGNSLVDMYSKCGNIKNARHVFDKMPSRNVVSWNSMIAGYTQNGYLNEALKLFCQMQTQGEGIKTDLVTLASVIPACAQLASLQIGEWMHGYVIKSGFLSDIVVGNCLIDVYTKCRHVESARQLFGNMPKKNVISWSALIAGYVQIGKASETLALFNQMQVLDMKPDAVTMLNMLSACTHLSALQQGKSLHAYIISSGYESEVFVANALIDMYAKCGSLELACLFFTKMSNRDLVSWNSMIAGYGMHGQGKNAVAHFCQLQQSSIKPNDVTFLCVLSACTHAGMVNEGWEYFYCMKQQYGITPKLEHYACMVDLLGRAGHLDEAVRFINNMPLEPGASVWGALLGACRIYSNITLGECAAERLFELEPENAGLYVLLSNIYAAAGRWDGVAKMRTIMKNSGLKKTPGCSFIEVKNKIHAFLVEDRSHPESEKIYATLQSLAVKMKAAGYVPNTSLLLQEME